MKILLTGAAGFIAGHVATKLTALGHDVVGVDTFDEQVHGDGKWKELRLGFRTDQGWWMHGGSGGIYPDGHLKEDFIAIHLGAKVGVGQSMYSLSEYIHYNTEDTAVMLDRFGRIRKPKRLIVASSMSIYGEGATVFSEKHPFNNQPWQFKDRKHVEAIEKPDDFIEFQSVPTPETKPPDLRSIYALTKYDQEQLCLIWGRAYDVPTVALRFFNCYGPGQSLNNPYTGVLAIFASRLLNDKPPVIYEDGLQTRDFIHVDDVANAVVHAATTDMPSGAYNVGTGVATSVRDVARRMISHIHPKVCPDSITVTGQHRKGDIRHCFADISKIKATGWEPKIPFDEGLMEYCAWLQTQPKPEDKFDQAHAELVEKGLCGGEKNAPFCDFAAETFRLGGEQIIKEIAAESRSKKT